MLSADEAFEPTVSTRSNSGCGTSFADNSSGRKFSSLPTLLANGFRIGMAVGWIVLYFVVLSSWWDAGWQLSCGLPGGFDVGFLKRNGRPENQNKLCIERDGVSQIGRLVAPSLVESVHVELIAVQDADMKRCRGQSWAEML